MATLAGIGGVLCILAFISAFNGAECITEQGIWNVNMTQSKTLAAFSKSMYNNTVISVSISCDEDLEYELGISWILRRSPCAEEYISLEKNPNITQYYSDSPGKDFFNYGYKTVTYQQSDVYGGKCHAHNIIQLPIDNWEQYTIDVTTLKPYVPKEEKQVKQNDKETDKSKDKDVEEETDKKEEETDEKVEESKEGGKKTRSRRDEEEALKALPTTPVATEKAPAKTPTPASKVTTKKPPPPVTSKEDEEEEKELEEEELKELEEEEGSDEVEFMSNVQLNQDNPDHLTETWEDGMYLFVIKVQPRETSIASLSLKVEMKGPHGYLSAIDWPLLPFYATMCAVYIVYGLFWLVMLCCNWRDLLRLQFWIGAVIFLGMLEKAVFLAEFESINNTGVSVRGAAVFAELVSCMKRTLARMLIVIVSLGFGIVKPRLGPMLHRVLGMGMLYFILGSVEGCLRVLRSKSDPSKDALLSSIPLAVLDAAICWWIFTGLVQTTRTLRLRRNVVKLSMYRHFTNTLIFAVLASVAYMIWSIKQHKLTTCLTDWKELWVDDAFWHVLFSVILLVIMILWRPTANNQRYAFSPLADAADDEAEEPMLNDAFDTVKMRPKDQSNGDSKRKDASKNKAEDDLKWIEENIPSSIADTALPSLLDSDEEIMTTKFEMSKME